MNSNLVFAGIVAVGVALGGLLAITSAKPPVAPSIEWLSQPRDVPIVRFSDGASYFSGEKFEDHWSLISFGFLDCPDVCPTTLSKLARLKRQFESPTLQTLFISINPQADTAQQVSQYAKAFHEQFLGVIVLDSKLEEFTSRLGIQYEVDGADVAHSVLTLIVGPDGKLIGRLRPGFDVDRVALELQAAMS